eukprot:COSAG01_NODE_4763_length_4757_cov_12.979390_7_plen_28_part_01
MPTFCSLDVGLWGQVTKNQSPSRARVQL